MSSGQSYAYANAVNNSRYNPEQYAPLSQLLSGSQSVTAGANPYAGSGNLDQVINQSNTDTIDAYNKNVAP